MKSINYIGLDVDTKNYSVAVLNSETGEIYEEKVRPNLKALTELLLGIKGKKKICYEAGYLGYSLCRALRDKGYECEVVAPSLIPEMKGDRIKTDRLDAIKLAKYLSSGLLTTIHIPDLEDEGARSLTRSRHFASGQLTQVKNRITGLCRSQGWDFKEEKNQKCYWTTLHLAWLEEKVLTANPTVAINLKILLMQRKDLLNIIEQYNKAIDTLKESPRYKESHQALTAYRSIETTTAMSIITELGDIARFESPRQITSYMGLDIAEYSSGGVHKRSGITRLGNAFLRYAFIESTQFGLYKPNIGRSLKKRREGINPKYIEIADRSMDRLYKKGSRLLYAGKHKNKVKVAMARELIGFIWESLRESKGLSKNNFIKGAVQIKKPIDSPR